jgi:DUF4097 and DUF4098 domain-containing protein YvlB
MTEQETYDRTRDAPPQEPPTLPDEEYYRQPERQARGTARLGKLLVLIGLAWLAIELIGYGPVFGDAHGSTRIPAPLPNNRIELQLGSGDVEIVPGDDTEVTIETTQYGLWRGDPAVISQSATGVLVTNEAKPRFGLCIGRCGLSYRVTMPRGTDITAHMSSGDVDISGAVGAVSITTSSGEVQARDIPNGIAVQTSSGDVRLDRIGGKLDIQTSSGEVQLEDGQVVGAAVQTSSGDIELDGVAGALDLHSTSGEITVREARDGRLNIQSSSGDVDYTGSLASDVEHSVATSSGEVSLRLPAASGFILETSTSSGEVRSDFQLRGEQREGNTRTGAVGAGGPRLKIGTSSGDIAILQQ